MVQVIQVVKMGSAINLRVHVDTMKVNDGIHQRRWMLLPLFIVYLHVIIKKPMRKKKSTSKINRLISGGRFLFEQKNSRYFLCLDAHINAVFKTVYSPPLIHSPLWCQLHIGHKHHGHQPIQEGWGQACHLDLRAKGCPYENYQHGWLGTAGQGTKK